MTSANTSLSPLVVVTGANGLVGAQVCRALSERDARVRAVVRKPGTAPNGPGIEEVVGEFFDPAFAATVVQGADAVVTTVHPMGSDYDTQHRIGVEGTATLAKEARDAGVPRLIHISTAAVYDRSAGTGDVDEKGALVDDDVDAYPRTKRDADAALAEVGGLTRILLRPPAILGAGDTSIWNTLRPADIGKDPEARRAVPERSFAWVHVTDLAAFAADLAAGRIPAVDDPEIGPVEGECTPVNVAAGPATAGDYIGTVAKAVGVEPTWEEGPSWTGQILAGRARAWGWKPQVELAEALAEITHGLQAR